MLPSISDQLLASVTGGIDINYGTGPGDVVDQVNERIGTCRALETESARQWKLGNAQGRQSSYIFARQAQRCWDSLKR